MLIEHRSGQPRALPDCEVGVLRRQIRQRRWLVLREGGVKCTQFLAQHAHGPAITDDVVHGQQQQVLLFTEHQYFGA